MQICSIFRFWLSFDQRRHIGFVKQMEALRRLFGISRSKDKPKPSKKKETTSHGKEGSKVVANEEAPSNATKQKAAAAKQYIEKHYKEQMKNLQERRERYDLYVPFHYPLFLIYVTGCG